jgi:hypothetical protein
LQTVCQGLLVKDGHNRLRSGLRVAARRELGKVMSEELERLIAVAKRVTPTPEHREEQRRSFAYGNTAYENPRITREMVDQQAEKLAAYDKRKA